MNISVRYFAQIRELTNKGGEDIDLPAGAKVHDLVESLHQRYAEIGALIEISRIAVNTDFSDAQSILHDGDEVAFIPPVSGG